MDDVSFHAYMQYSYERVLGQTDDVLLHAYRQ